MGFTLYFQIVNIALHFLLKFGKQKVTAIIHRFTYRATSDPKNVVIIGGSFSGMHLARLLSTSIPTGYKVTLVEKNTHMHYCFAFPRFSVLSGHDYKAFIPYEGLLGHAPEGAISVVHEKAINILNNHIELASDEKISYEYLVIATGVSQPAPARLSATDKIEGEGELRGYQKAIQASSRIAVVGGGAVGVELATDIKSFLPDKNVTLIHSRDRLLVRFGPQLHEVAYNRLQELGVRVHFNERPSLPDRKPFMPSETDIVFKDGQVETFDLVISCIGQSPNSSPLKPFLPDAITENGFIRVEPTLQVKSENENYRNIFAIGDVAATDGPKMAFAGMAQADVACSNILTLIRGHQNTLQPYVPSFIEGKIKLSLGKDRGVFFMENENGYLLKLSNHDKPDIDAKKVWRFFGADVKEWKN
ncbi:putative amid-like nadh protein [Botrytis fragariae]|uniref:Putative amid-like nadh protein n=1 Tax=Botrytis fragariae TaxID=1964551 RepID=A0A8H6EKJ1_9HELO|nr:putative amid-like nadh protein [Botrytis fragariae]KAF5875642.1 putative amid-like nadh protein [Botrytis fragariae]